MGLEEVGHEPQHLVQAQVTLAVEANFVQTCVLLLKQDTGNTGCRSWQQQAARHNRQTGAGGLQTLHEGREA